MANVHNLSPASSGLMLRDLARNWWLILLRGIAAIAFGVLAFVWPGITLVTLALLYGAFALVEGALALAAAVAGGSPAPRWWLVIVGLLGVAVGVLTIMMPGMTALLLVLLVAGWAIATGIMQIIGAIRLRREIDNEWMLVAVGLISVLFGVLVAIQPIVGAISLVFVLGAYAIIFGITLVGFAFRLRRHARG
jgi:uncharacterized membrane protein HdeD (DUF308 family)